MSETNPHQHRRQGTRRNLADGASGATFVALLIGAVVFLNLLSAQIFTRFDITRDSRYTLAPASRELMRSLPVPVSIYVFLSGELPQPYDALEREVADLLAEYAAHADDNFEYFIIDPGADEADQERAANFGIQPVTIGEQSRDALSFRDVHMGLAIVAAHDDGDRTEVIPQLFPGMNHEYELTRRLRQLTTTDERPTVGVAIGDGSFIDQMIEQATQGGPMGQPPADRSTVVSEISQALALQVFDELFSVELVDLNSPAPDSVDGLIVLGPTEQLPQTWLDNLDAFVRTGKGVAIFASAFRSQDLGGQFGGVSIPEVNATGLESLLQQYGATISQDRLLDREAAQVSVTMQVVGYMGQQEIRQPIPTVDPRLPIISQLNPESILVPNVPLLAFQPRNRNTPLPITPLVLTDAAQAAVQEGSLRVINVASTGPSSVTVQGQNSLSLEQAIEPIAGEVTGSQPVIMTIEGELPGAGEGSAAPVSTGVRLLVASSGDFITNIFTGNDPLSDPGLLRSMPPQVASSVQQYTMSSILFLKNTADWLVSDADLVSIRSRGLPTYVQNDQLNRQSRTFYQLINIVLVPLVFVAVGISAAWSRRRRRRKLSERFQMA